MATTEKPPSAAAVDTVVSPAADVAGTAPSPSSAPDTRADQSSQPPDKDEDEPPLSKNQLKKRRRWEKSQAVKRRRKEQERAVRRAKAAKEGRDLDAERQQQLANQKEGRGWKRREERWKETMEKADTENSFRVCFDCTFEDQMSWKEANSLGLQLRYAYAMNRKSPMPVYIDVCGMKKGGSTMGHLEKVEGFPERWVGRAFRCYEEGLEEVYGGSVGENGEGGAGADEEKKCEEKDEQTSSVKSDAVANNDAKNDSNDATGNNDSGEQPYPQMRPDHQFVYLTGDSPHTLTTLDNNTTYIIGGIVDRNRLKRAAIERAESITAEHPTLNIKTARLPLDEHVDFKGSTRVLTCNHVFEILQKYRENGYKDWKGSILAVLPCRKDLEEREDGGEEGAAEEGGGIGVAGDEEDDPVERNKDFVPV